MEPEKTLNTATKMGLGVLGAALGLGVLADALLRPSPSGINVLIWIAALLTVAIALLTWQRVPLRGEGRGLILPLLLFAAAIAWRDSPVLKSLDLLALLTLLALAALRTRSGSVRVAGVMEYALCLLITGLNALIGPTLVVFRDVQWQEIPRNGWLRHSTAVGRGLLLALPLLLIFGALLVAADATFERIVRATVNIDPQIAASHLLLIGFFAWIVCGYLRAALLREETPRQSLPLLQERPQLLALGIVEIGVVLGLLDLLFLSFVCVQARYFFGGQAHVLATAGLTSADYARRGFFELVSVAALALPLLLLLEWVLAKESPRIERIFRLLAGGMTLLLFAIMASAMQRMHLYHVGYGLTELRVYTTAFMGWLAAVFVWFLATVLRGKRDRFVFGAFVSGLLTIGLLHALNPDALIVRANVRVTQTHADRQFDTDYAFSLSADAAPALIEALPALPLPERATIANILLHTTDKRSDWRTWSVARMQQEQVMQRNAPLLQGLEVQYKRNLSPQP